MLEQRGGVDVACPVRGEDRKASEVLYWGPGIWKKGKDPEALGTWIKHLWRCQS